MKKKYLYIDKEYIGQKTKAEIKKLAKKGKLKALVCKTNGYSHDWSEVEELTDAHLQKANIYLTSKPSGFVPGSSEVSFS